MFVAVVGNYLYKKRTGTYKPYSTGVSDGASPYMHSASPAAPSAAYTGFTAAPAKPTTGSSGGYGAL